MSSYAVTFGEAFVATLTVENPTHRDVTLTTPMGCLALPSIYRDGDRQDWDGTALGCLAAVTDHVVPAGGALTLEFEIRAAMRSGDDPFGYTEPPAPGPYEVRMETYARLPEVSTGVLVVP